MLYKQIDADIDTGYYIQESSIVMCIVLYKYCNIVGAICTALSK
jgi:hypothetical protein